MEKQPVTIYDIAYRAGVSQSTVSRVLSGAKRVASDKREAVLTAVRELRYRPNPFAQRLARGGTNATQAPTLVGVLAADSESPFCVSVIEGLQRAFAGSFCLPVVVSIKRSGSALAAVEQLRAANVSAVAMVCRPTEVSDLGGLEREVPCFAVSSPLPGWDGRCLEVDNEAGARLAVEHLIALGHERIAHLAGPEGHSHAVARRRGWEQALAAHGLATPAELVSFGSWSESSGLERTTRMLDEGLAFTAIFASNDLIAFGARLALYRRGLDVPSNVSLVGFDDHPHAEYATPPLSTVRQPAVEMGEAMGLRVMAALGGGAEDEEPAAFEPRLVVRDSTARPNASRPLVRAAP